MKIYFIGYYRGKFRVVYQSILHKLLMEIEVVFNHIVKQIKNKLNLFENIFNETVPKLFSKVENLYLNSIQDQRVQINL